MSSLAARRMARRPALEAKLRHMAQTLQPLVNAVTGAVHPDFPLTIFQYWLLNDKQLDALASFYHQRTPHPLKQHYPCPVLWPRRGLTLEDKRRRFGRFIGLRGCETPPLPVGLFQDSQKDVGQQQYGCGQDHPVSWYNQDLECIPCAMRHINDILNRGDVHSVADADMMDSWDTMDDASTLVDAEVDMDVDMMETEVGIDLEAKPLTIDDVIENAQRARLEANAGAEVLRRKSGHY
ncbi:hypothetical protein SEPCBS119000_001859 [Sporothrix epigloea]|uniref:Uncharacterized protein n=1 Tax=Sporothrix epigloea TaxID=1892477 RepID=A0ABP0DD14_9PEZI